ncbi:MAG TPA: LamG-like jellyroll fold domain-containing protein [Candidatus Methanoperedens sp.]|nr:LamG-like jellyroll fold domain-containing protein [Candidatus Methanoperedens sp.]
MIINRIYGEHLHRIAIGISLFAILLLVSIAGAVPYAYIANTGSDNVSVSGISFTGPTPTNGTILAQNFVYINTTVSNASTAFIDWNRSLVGWWRFNSETGENSTFFRDWSTWENNATCSGINCPASTSGKFGNALRFDGVNDYVDTGNAPGLNITGNITIEAWVKPERLETAHIVKKATRDSTDGYELSLSESTGKAYFRVNQKTSHNTYKLFSNSSYPLDGNTWVHLVGVYNRDQVQIYFNGNLENSMSGPTNILSNTDNLKIGGPDLSRYFKGTIDEVRIWDRALSPEEIKASYDAGIYRLYSNFTNLANGVYNYRTYAQNLQGNVNQTEKMTLHVNLGLENTPISPVIKIMPLGDSITSSDSSYRNRLWDLLANNSINVDFVGSLSSGYETLPDKDHEGHKGWKIDKISARVEDWLSIYRPDIVLLHIGTNDISHNYNLETAPDRLGTLIDKIAVKSPKTKVIVASIIPRKTDNNATIAYNNAIRGVVTNRQSQGKNVYFADIYNEAGINTDTDLSNEVHPNIKGSNKMADVWFKQLKIVLSQ